MGRTVNRGSSGIPVQYSRRSAYASVEGHFVRGISPPHDSRASASVGRRTTVVGATKYAAKGRYRTSDGGDRDRDRRRLGLGRFGPPGQTPAQRSRGGSGLQ